MKDYLDKLKKYADVLKKCAKWENTEVTIGLLDVNSQNGMDYIYELFCYLSILDDLKDNYDLEYYAGFGKTKNCFPCSPSNKKGRPLFYLKAKFTNKRLFQICAGTKINSKLKNKKRAPDISFQIENADMSLPNYNEVKMIFDAKRKRDKPHLSSITGGQYAYFALMIREIGVEQAITTNINFKELKLFNGNCLITNKKAYSGIKENNQFHNIKEVEFFDSTLDLTRIQVIG